MMKNFIFIFALCLFFTPCHEILASESQDTVKTTKKSALEDKKISEITSFTKDIISKAVSASKNHNKDAYYKEILKLVENHFDYKNLAKFGMARNFKKLTDEQKDYLYKYSKRSIVVLFMRKFVIKNFSYEITKVVKTSRPKTYNVYIEVKNIEGIQLKDFEPELKEKNLDKIEIVFSVKENDQSYILEDVGAFNLSFVQITRDFYQKIINKNGDDVNLIIEDLIDSLERSETALRNQEGISQGLFPPIKELLLEL